jgi:hypothetical protein
MTKLNWRGFPEGNGYFDELPMLQRKMIERMTIAAFEEYVRGDTFGHEGSYTVENIECRSRSGFIPHSHNRGGVDVQGYTDLNGIQGSGYFPRNKDAADKIQGLIDSSLQYAAESFFEKHQAVFEKYNLTVADAYYHRIEEIENSPNPDFEGLTNEIQDYENEHLSGDYSSVMYQIRVMYHGKDASGVHSLSVFASISASDAPYHRSSDVVSEQLITWKTGKGLKTKLAKALRKACEGAF